MISPMTFDALMDEMGNDLCSQSALHLRVTVRWTVRARDVNLTARLNLTFSRHQASVF